MNRRSFLATVPAMGTAAIVPAMAEPAMTPDERIDAALDQIRIAYREKYPDCPLRIEDCDNGDDGMLMILSHCADDAPGSWHHRRFGSARKTA